MAEMCPLWVWVWKWKVSYLPIAPCVISAYSCLTRNRHISPSHWRGWETGGADGMFGELLCLLQTGTWVRRFISKLISSSVKWRYEEYQVPTSVPEALLGGAQDSFIGSGRSDSLLFFFCLFAFSRAAPLAYGGPQARGLIEAVAAGLHQSHSNWGIWAASVTYTIARGNTGSLTHWVRPGIEPETSWFLFGFVNHWATVGTPDSLLNTNIIYPLYSLMNFPEATWHVISQKTEWRSR